MLEITEMLDIQDLFNRLFIVLNLNDLFSSLTSLQTHRITPTPKSNKDYMHLPYFLSKCEKILFSNRN